MTLLNTITEKIETIGDVLKGGEDARIRQQVIDKAAAEQAQRDEQAAQNKAEYERMVAYLALPHRPLAEVQAAIDAVQAERDGFAQRLANFEATIGQDDNPVSPKQATELAAERSLLLFNIQSCDRRLKRLADELADARRVDRLNAVQISIADYVDLAESLQKFEAGPFVEIERAYREAMDYRRKTRAQLTLWQLESTNVLTSETAALANPYNDLIHTTWKQV